ncbi:MAG: hypothetical protein HOG24_09100 [Candidatus Cloacimonetes bacterium]|nr:hypothetical protein [Candidatus Cloacimonadota bacterium]
MKRSIFIMMMLAAVIGLSAVTQEVLMNEKNIILEFDNVNIKEIEFIEGNVIVIEHSKNFDVEIIQEKGKMIVKSENIAKVELELPIEKTYTLMENEAKIEFDYSRVTIIEDETTVVEFRDGGLFVTEGEDTVEISADGIIVHDDDEHVEISSSGIIIDSPDEQQRITGFWGQLLGGAINFITKHSIGWIGNNPGFIVKHIVNDGEYHGGVNIDFDSPDKKKITKEFHETFQPKRGCKLNVHNRNGSVEIESWENDYIDIFATLETRKSEEEFDKIKIEVLDNCTIKTTSLKKNPKVSVHYQIKVPDGVKISSISSSNGSIDISECEGKMNLKTSNGSIEIEDSEGSFTANTSNGKIEFENLQGVAEAHTSNGSIKVSGTSNFKKAVTSNGKIILEIDEKLKDDIYLSTSNGSIKIYLDLSLDLKVKASTSNARIDLNGIEITTSVLSSDYISGKINKGGKMITAKTSNGSIKFYKLEK